MFVEREPSAPTANDSILTTIANGFVIPKSVNILASSGLTLFVMPDHPCLKFKKAVIKISMPLTIFMLFV